MEVGFTDEHLEFLLKQVVVVQSIAGILGSVLHSVSSESGQRVIRIRMIPEGNEPYIVDVGLAAYCEGFQAANVELRQKEREVLSVRS